MRRGAKSALIGKWRIIEMGLWDNDYLDMVEPAYIQFKANGLGEFKFGCVVGGLDCTLFADAADFTWQGSDEMDPVSGDGSAQLDDDGTINGEISFHLGDESTFKALLAHVLDHLPLPRNELQRLGYVLADLAQPVIATAWAGRRYRIDDALPRQMLRQRPARRLAALE